MPKFVITIDTETFRVRGRALPFNTHHYADLPEGSFGVQRIMDLCDENDVKATFFVDVYMHYEYGETKVAELCQRIDLAGHDVQLHVHTSWLPDTHSGLICDFPLDRQIEILAEGKNLIEKWIGKAPRGFRAGAYGANLDTIRALKENDFRIDSSYFPLNRNCKLARQIGCPPLNRSFYIDGVLEIPVTTYWLWNAFSRQKNSKIDVNACSWTELQNVLPKFSDSPVDYVILFLHSFSFVQWDRNGGNLAPKRGPLKRFEALLKLIRQELGGEVITIDEISKQLPPGTDTKADFVPRLSPIHMVPRILGRFFD
jgi:hypothetical protein